MIGALLSGVSAAAITASLSGTPLTWSDLFTTTFNNTTGITTNRTYFMVYTPKVLPFTKCRLSIEAIVSGGYTVSKMYVGPVSATRSGFMFQSAPVPVTFDGGSPSVVLPASSSKLSDEISLTFTGDHALGVAFIISAATGSQRRILAPSNLWAAFAAAGDLFPDPSITTAGQIASTALWLIADMDVVYGHFVPVNKILASHQLLHVVKEGCSPPDAQIKAVNQSFYVVKG